MSINVEFLVGTDLEEALLEARKKCSQWGVSYVSFKFNGVAFSIGPTADIQKALQEYAKNQKAILNIICH